MWLVDSNMFVDNPTPQYHFHIELYTNTRKRATSSSIKPWKKTGMDEELAPIFRQKLSMTVIHHRIVKSDSVMSCHFLDFEEHCEEGDAANTVEPEINSSLEAYRTSQTLCHLCSIGFYWKVIQKSWFNSLETEATIIDQYQWLNVRNHFSSFPWEIMNTQRNNAPTNSPHTVKVQKPGHLNGVLKYTVSKHLFSR